MTVNHEHGKQALSIAETSDGDESESWPEPLHRRYMGGVKCDMKTGPCSCGAWHHPNSSEFEALSENDRQRALRGG